MFDVLMELSDAQLRQIPQELANIPIGMAEAGQLPEEPEQRVRKLFRR